VPQLPREAPQQITKTLEGVKMQTMKVRIDGKVPLLMHCNQMANPLNVYSRAIKPLTAKRKKTDADHLEISRVEWEAGLYFDNDGHVCIPAEVIEATLRNAARKTKNGKLIEEGVRVEENFCKFEYPNNGYYRKTKPEKPENLPSKELDKMYEKFSDCRLAKVKGSGGTVLRTRPRFDKWAVEFTLMYDENIISERTLSEVIGVAGDRIGLCDYRPRYGLFNSKII
jgi:hypothetical protein